jgi:hypothetical protein
MKTPLSDAYETKLEEGDASKFTAQMAVDNFVSKTIDCGLIIDASFDEHYLHDSAEFEDWDIKLVKVRCADAVEDPEELQVPPPETIQQFCKEVYAFWQQQQGRHICVFGHDGNNFVGFLIVCAMVELLRVPVNEAIARFSSCRKPGIFSLACLEALWLRYNSTILPPPPVHFRVPPGTAPARLSSEKRGTVVKAVFGVPAPPDWCSETTLQWCSAPLDVEMMLASSGNTEGTKKDANGKAAAGAKGAKRPAGSMRPPPPGGSSSSSAAAGTKGLTEGLLPPPSKRPRKGATGTRAPSSTGTRAPSSASGTATTAAAAAAAGPSPLGIGTLVPLNSTQDRRNRQVCAELLGLPHSHMLFQPRTVGAAGAGAGAGAAEEGVGVGASAGATHVDFPSKDFPGCHAVPLGQEHIDGSTGSAGLNAKYMVSWRAVGQRVLVLALREGVYLMDSVTMQSTKVDLWLPSKPTAQPEVQPPSAPPQMQHRTLLDAGGGGLSVGSIRCIYPLDQSVAYIHWINLFGTSFDSSVIEHTRMNHLLLNTHV